LKVNIVSPHIDDAAFGLALTIWRCARSDISVTIINCFTVTKWTAIAVENKEIEAVGRLRKSEDVEFYNVINKNIKIVNLDLLDAPLRNGYIFQYKPFQPNELELIEQLHALLKQHTDGILFCPLGIGGHIDHAICRAAILKMYGEAPVLFYEDLPYARRISHQQILQQIQALEKELGIKLCNEIGGFANCTVDKKQVIGLYKSQMNDEISSEIIAHLNELKGERIWGEEKIIEQFKMSMRTNH
jgi:LmbE family N-acetylglucosaminyl deacetylase